jgi:hypothetical protein
MKMLRGNFFSKISLAQGSVEHRTKTIKSTSEPHWNEVCWELFLKNIIKILFYNVRYLNLLLNKVKVIQ